MEERDRESVEVCAVSARDEDEAIARYDAAGGGPSRFAPVHWPDVVVTEENLLALVEGVVSARIDFVREAFGDALDPAACADRLEEAWRRDAAQVRFAPEGVFVRAAFSVRLCLRDEDGGEEAVEVLAVEVELCLSFSTRRHARPFVDVMSGRITRESDGAARAVDPFAMSIEPQDAVAWGLNGAES